MNIILQALQMKQIKKKHLDIGDQKYHKSYQPNYIIGK